MLFLWVFRSFFYGDIGFFGMQKVLNSKKRNKSLSFVKNRKWHFFLK